MKRVQELEKWTSAMAQGQGRFGSEDPNIIKEKHLSSKEQNMRRISVWKYWLIFSKFEDLAQIF